MLDTYTTHIEKEDAEDTEKIEDEVDANKGQEYNENIGSIT